MSRKPIEQRNITKNGLGKHKHEEIAGSYYYSSKIKRVIVVDLISYLWLIKFHIIKNSALVPWH